MPRSLHEQEFLTNITNQDIYIYIYIYCNVRLEDSVLIRKRMMIQGVTFFLEKWPVEMGQYIFGPLSVEMVSLLLYAVASRYNTSQYKKVSGAAWKHSWQDSDQNFRLQKTLNDTGHETSDASPLKTRSSHIEGLMYIFSVPDSRFYHVFFKYFYKTTNGVLATSRSPGEVNVNQGLFQYPIRRLIANSRSLEATRFLFRIDWSLWNFTGTSAALVPTCL